MSAPVEPRKCFVCKSMIGVRNFEIRVEGEPLRMNFDLCAQHGNTYLFRIGAVVGELLKENREGDT